MSTKLKKSFFPLTLLFIIVERIKMQKIFSSETALFFVFAFAQIFISTNKIYLLFIALYLCGLYLISKNLLRSAWFTFLSTLLFLQGKYFVDIISIPTSQSALTIPVLYNIKFSDVFLLFVIFLLKKNHEKFNLSRKAHSFDLLFIPIIFFGLVSSWFSYFPEISFFYLLQIVKYVVIYFIGGIMLRDYKIKKTTFEIIIVFTLFNAVLIVLQRILGGPLGLPGEHSNTWSTLGRFAFEQSDIYRPGGTMDDPNLVASFIGMLLPVLVFLGFVRNRFNSMVIRITAAIAAIGLLFTGSRAVWLVLVPIGLFGVYLFKRLRLEILKPATLSARNIVRALLIFSAFLPLIIIRLSTLATAFNDNGSGMYRIRHLEIAKDYILNFPFGIGLSVFQYLTPMRYEAWDYSYQIAEPHNIFAQIGSELGIFGLFLFCAVFFCILLNKYRVAIRKKDTLNTGIFLGCISYLVIACFYPWFIYSPISEVFWLFMGVTSND